MKARLIIALFAMVALTACEKDLSDPSRNQDEKTVKDLVVSPDFDWNMIENTTCNLVSDYSTVLSIYLNEACSKEQLLATIPVKAGTNANLPLSILKDTKAVYVQYENATGKKTVVSAPVKADGTISFTVPADSQKPKTRAEGDFDPQTPGILCYPNSGWGTVMFEDNYPSLGDYDFNDFVAKYAMTIEIDPDDQFKRIQRISFEMNVYAIGGISPLVPCLRLPFSPASIKSAILEPSKGTTNAELRLEQTEDNSFKNPHAVFIFHGAEKNDSKNPLSQFLNTEKGISSSTKAMILTIEFNDNQAYVEDLGKNFFDLFLMSPDKSKEIHMLNFAPIFQPGFENSIFGLDDHYKTEKNLVWGINIADGDMLHALEKVNFLKAYPSFSIWAESSASEMNDWYKNAKSEFLFHF